MNSLFRKELQTFFGNVSGYLVVATFLLFSGLFLWVIPGDFNILEGQRASLDGLFDLAPWVYLFLIPAITMRMFAEERRTGTIELLITRPIKPLGIVWAKYLAALVLVLISLLPTLIYLFTIHHIGAPKGNIDMGATWGSFIGLFLLASVYIAVGLWASSLSANQVVAFLIAIISCFLLYLGFDFAASAGLPETAQGLLVQLGINEHYRSISRGVADSRNLSYYAASTFFFLFLASLKISPKKLRFNLKKLTLIVLAIALTGILMNFRLFRIDLTTEKRYSLSETTKKLLKEQEDYLFVELYLTGDMPAGMREFRNAIVEKIEELNAYSPRRIFHKTFDIYSISTVSKRNEAINQLIELGIQPVNFNYKTNEGLSVRQIFPGILIQYKDRSIGLDLLRRSPMNTADENLRQSIELLEYELVRALRILIREEMPTVAFLTGHDEANAYETGDLRHALKNNYRLKDVTAEELIRNDSVDILIVADPKERFSIEDKLFIDQFVMRGGKTLWCVDPVFCSIDSLSRGYSTIALGVDLNLTDLLFKYGVRMNPVLIQDVVCAQYPVNTAPPGQTTQFVPAPFYYAPLAQPSANHPISRNLSHIITEFPSMIEAVGESENLVTHPILTTSAYARKINTPVEVSLLSATMPPDRNLFTQSFIPLATVTEGKFESLFKNRPTSHTNIPAGQIIKESPNNKMIVIANASIIKNKARQEGERIQIYPLGHDPYSGQTFGNRDFLLNCIDYLSDHEGIMQLRSRVVQLRLLDKVIVREKETMIKLGNVLAPVLAIIVIGLTFQLLRIRKHSRKKSSSAS